jgi:lysophospholipase L1-like esterase
MMSTIRRVLSAIPGTVLVASTTLAAGACHGSFADFDARAKAGERLSVVYFGASLTWGANATDQALTSYRARVTEMLEARYPKARFKTYDAAIGGTQSLLGVFRLERDVLSRHPDLVFIDFSANDDNWGGNPEVFASYESLIRRIILEAKAPVVTVLFPFRWEQDPAVKSGNSEHLGGLRQRKVIAAAYHVPVGDAVELITQRVKAGRATLDQIWDTDGVHPGDFGYRLFAEAAFAAFDVGVKSKATCVVPKQMLHADTFMTSSRVQLAELFGADGLPKGWRVGKPGLTAGCHDQVMSRWLDSEVIASNRLTSKDDKGKDVVTPVVAERLVVKVKASYVMLFGETTVASGGYHVWIDGKQHLYTPYGKKEATALYDIGAIGKRFNANWNYYQMIVNDLDPAVEHTIEIEPVFADGQEQELRFESVCVAGGAATVRRAPAPAAK